MFQKELMTPDEAAAIVKNAATLARATIADKSSQRPFSVQVQTINLTTAQLETNPYRISTSFKSIYVSDATDINVSVNLRFNTRDSIQGAVPIRKNDSIVLDEPTNEAYLHWSAQSGKTLTLVIFTDAAFQSGSQISVSGGGVSINDGTSVAATTQVTLVATTAAAVVPANTSRKNCLVQNNSGTDLYLSGASTVTNAGATRGIKIPDGGIYEYRNTAILYGYSVAGGDVNYMDMT